MMRNFILMMFFSSISVCNAQNVCKSLTFGDIFLLLKNVDLKRELNLNIQKYAAFDFKKFKPEGEVSSGDYFEIGYDSKGTIEEIVHRDDKKPNLTYRMLVYDYSEYRILLSQYYTKTGFLFNATAFIMIKDASINFMINLFPQFDPDHGHNGFILSNDFYNNGIDDMSAIMILDLDFFPQKLYKFSKKQIVMASYFNYDKKDSHKFQGEYVYLFFNTPLHPAVKVDQNTCLSDLSNVYPNADLIIPQEPAFGEGTIQTLWLMSGAHQYINCIGKSSNIK